METSSAEYYNASLEGFKSYYVVWKLRPGNLSCFSIVGLNRTMQYGNNSGKTLDTSPDICLNRTMQYGNKKKTTEDEEHKEV